MCFRIEDYQCIFVDTDNRVNESFGHSRGRDVTYNYQLLSTRAAFFHNDRIET